MITKLFNPATNTIHVDLDGVLADFDGHIQEKLGRTFNVDPVPGEDQIMWDYVKTVERFYFHLQPTAYMTQLWDAVGKLTANRQILTAVPRRTTCPTAEQDKRDWCARHLGPHTKVVVGPFSRDKWKHCKPGDILIDDREDNIDEWQDKGQGIGILHVGDIDLTLALLQIAVNGLPEEKDESDEQPQGGPYYDQFQDTEI